MGKFNHSVKPLFKKREVVKVLTKEEVEEKLKGKSPEEVQKIIQEAFIAAGKSRPYRNPKKPKDPIVIFNEEL